MLSDSAMLARAGYVGTPPTLFEMNCERCSSPFETDVWNQRFCTPACRIISHGATLGASEPRLRSLRHELLTAVGRHPGISVSGLRKALTGKQNVKDLVLALCVEEGKVVCVKDGKAHRHFLPTGGRK